MNATVLAIFAAIAVGYIVFLLKHERRPWLTPWTRLLR